jgi:hypothetical protein
VRRFEQEARAVAALNHPNIITVFEVGEAEGLRFIVTEYVEGETLRELLARGKLTPERALGRGLRRRRARSRRRTRWASSTGDVKPENIMLRRDGFVKVLDFGLAKLTQHHAAAVDMGAPTGSIVKTAPGVVLGTVQYMSPEQARNLEVDERTDIFSLGVVLYEMLTGLRPFAGETPSHVIVADLDRRTACRSRSSQKVPAALGANRPPRRSQGYGGTLSDDARVCSTTLRELRDELAFSLRAGRGPFEPAELTRSDNAQRSAGDGGKRAGVGGRNRDRTSTGLPPVRSTSGGGLARHKRWVVLALGGAARPRVGRGRQAVQIRCADGRARALSRTLGSRKSRSRTRSMRVASRPTASISFTFVDVRRAEPLA